MKKLNPHNYQKNYFIAQLCLVVAFATIGGLFFYPNNSIGAEEKSSNGKGKDPAPEQISAMTGEENPYYGYERAPIPAELYGRVNTFSGAFTSSFPMVTP